MKIAYVVNARIPTEKAHGYQIVRTCLELKKAGVDITLYVPERSNHIKEDAFSFYGLEKNFNIVYIKCFEWLNLVRVLGPFAFYLQSRSFLKQLFSSNMITNDTVIYTRDADTVSFFSEHGFACIYNAHNWPANDHRIKKLLSGAQAIVCNSKGTEEAVKKALNKPTVIIHNATDANPFVGAGVSNTRKIVTYVGHLYGWKGTDIIIPLAQSFAGDENVVFRVIGGTPSDIKRFSIQLAKTGLRNVDLLGYKKKELIPKCLAESDVLLLPNMPVSEESVRYTSPLKLFEYMASGVPIVASDLPSIRAILPENAGYYVPAGDVPGFAGAIRQAFSSKDRAKNALKESQKYSWSSQIAILVEFIKKFS